MTTGMSRVRSSARIARRTSRPFTLGSFRSSRTTWGEMGKGGGGGGARAKNPVEGLLSILNVNGAVRKPVFFQGALRQFGVTRIVFHQKNFNLTVVHYWSPFPLAA